MKNFVQCGDTLNFTNSTGDTLLGGSVQIFGSIPGVLVADIPDGETGALQTEGVFSLPKATGGGTGISAGDRVYWNADDEIVEKTASGNVLLGTCTETAATTDDTVNVRLVSTTLSAEDSSAQAANVAKFGTVANLTAVPGSFADVAAVRTYLITLQAEIETRLDNLESKTNSVIQSLVDAEQMADS